MNQNASTYECSLNVYLLVCVYTSSMFMYDDISWGYATASDQHTHARKCNKKNSKAQANQTIRIWKKNFFGRFWIYN